MKVKIILDLPENQQEFDNFVNADKMASLLFEIKHNLSKRARDEFEFRKGQGTLKDYEDELDMFFSLIEDELKELSNL